MSDEKFENLKVIVLDLLEKVRYLEAEQGRILLDQSMASVVAPGTLTFNPGDVAWILMSTALVFLMTNYHHHYTYYYYYYNHYYH